MARSVFPRPSLESSGKGTLPALGDYDSSLTNGELTVAFSMIDGSFK
jgi:hypothetical protein